MVRQRIFQGGTCTLQVPQPTSPPFALEPLYDAMDQVLECVSSPPGSAQRTAAAVLPPEEAAEPQPEEAAEPAKQAEEEDGESSAATIASASRRS